MKTQFLFVCLLWSALMIATTGVQAQVVAVTLSLDTNTIAVGQSTTLRVFAQIVPAHRAGADRIFSWYVDVLNTNGNAASATYGAMQKAASDNDPLTSSTGFADGPHRRAIYDTFLNAASGTGRDAPVELMAIPVRGLAGGHVRFLVKAGTGVPELSEDIIVAPIGGGDPLTGGNYDAAAADLEVVPDSCNVQLQIAPLTVGQFLLSFTPCAGFNHTVEYRDALGGGPNWQPLPGAPHNSGSVIVNNSGSQRFYRVKSQ